MRFWYCGKEVYENDTYNKSEANFTLVWILIINDVIFNNGQK